jgi:hypothetical protein
MPDIKSSSESIVVAAVSGVGGSEIPAAEAILLLDRVAAVVEEESIASAAFLFLGWEEMVSTVKGLLDRSGCSNRVSGVHGQ